MTWLGKLADGYIKMNGAGDINMAMALYGNGYGNCNSNMAVSTLRTGLCIMQFGNGCDSTPVC